MDQVCQKAQMSGEAMCYCPTKRRRETNLFVISFSDKQTFEKSEHKGDEMRLNKAHPQE